MTATRDPFGAAVFAAAHLAETSACGRCGNPDPARVGEAGCEACHAYPRCAICRRWTDLFPSTSVVVGGVLVELCDACRERTA